MIFVVLRKITVLGNFGFENIKVTIVEVQESRFKISKIFKGKLLSASIPPSS